MLRYVRAQLLERDNAGCLQRLKTYPPIEDVGRLVELAIKLYRGEPTPEIDGPAGGTAEKTAAPVPSGTDPLSMAANALSSVTSKALFSSASQAGSSGSASNVSGANRGSKTTGGGRGAGARSSNGTNVHMAERLERIILSLQTEMRESESIASNETILFALAELKHIRDVLSGRLE